MVSMINCCLLSLNDLLLYCWLYSFTGNRNRLVPISFARINIMPIIEKLSDVVEQHANESIMDYAKHLTLYKMGSGLQMYYLPVACVIGFVGNAISLVVLLQPHNKRLSCCLYLAGLAVNDNCIIYIAMHYWCIRSLKVGNLTNFQCRWIAYFFHVSLHSIFSLSETKSLSGVCGSIRKLNSCSRITNCLCKSTVM